MPRSLANPETLEGRLYLPSGDMHIVAYDPTRDDYKHMDQAIAEAHLALDEGNPAIGAVIVTPTAVYPGHSTEITDDDLRKHAEMNAYGKAQPELGTDMSKTMWYTTVEPCGMCLSPILQGRVGTLFYAASYEDAPDFFRQKEYDFDKMIRAAGRTLLVVAGLRREESLRLLHPQNKRHKSAHE